MKYTLERNILKIEISSLYVDTIQAFFDEYIPSKKIQHLLIQNKWINLDGNPVKRESDIVGIYLNINIYPETYDFEAVDNKADIIYEDPFILIAFKPKGVLVHSDGNQEITLTDILKSQYIDQNYLFLQPLHRLDKETSGLVVYSKSIIFQPLFDDLMNKKQIRRYYYAFTKNKCDVDKTLTINKPIGKDRHSPNKRVVYKDGQEAITKVKCIASKNGVSIFRCILDTGRTHQIRVHLASVGYPLLNDELYGITSNKLNRMGLIANEVELYHPIKEDKINIEIDLPKDMSNLLNETI